MRSRRGTRGRVLRTVAALAVIATSGGVAGQAGEQAAQAEARAAYRDALAESERATTLARTATLDQAVALLEGTLAQCPPSDGGVACRRVALYTLGYLHNDAAERRSADRERLLRDASRYFSALLSEDPDYEAARRGLALVYRKLGAHEWQEADLRTLAERDPTGRYHVVLGDYYREQGRAEDAAAAYRRAVELDPAGEAPRRRLVSLYRVERLDPAGLLDLLAAWEDRFPDLAAEGYHLAMRRAYPGSWRAAADVLPRWLAAVDAADQLSPRLVERVPEDWGAPPFASLRAYMLDPARGGLDPWWSERRERAEAAGAVALSLGQWRWAEGDPAAAEAVWRDGLDLAPPYSPVWVDLTAALARLYSEVPERDPDGARFRSLEKELFTGKGQAIGRRDYEAMFRFHSTLGTIYARRGVWGSPEDRGTLGYPDVRTAVFQLDRAVMAADALLDETGLYRPVPRIRRALAEALLAAGDAVGARAAFVDAARAALDTDDLAGAADALRSARAGEPGAPSGARAEEAVGQWLELRRGIEAALGPDGPGACPEELVSRVREQAAAPDEDAAARQRFKALADCARAGGGVELAADALQEVLSRRAPLVGVGDWVRFEETRRSVFGGFGQRVEPLTPTRAPAGPAGSVPLTLPGEDAGVYLPAGPDALLAARLVLELRPSRAPLELRVRDGEVRVLELGGRSLEALRRMEGVVSVRTGS